MPRHLTDGCYGYTRMYEQTNAGEAIIFKKAL